MQSFIGRRSVLPAFVLSILSGCSSGSGQVPPGATVEISPASRSWAINDNGSCSETYDPGYFQDNVMTIRVLDEQARPIGDVEVMVSLALAGNTFSGVQFVQLFEDKDGDYTPDDDELVSDVGDALLFTKTDFYDGSKTLIVRTNLSCTYSSILSVVAEGASAEATIEVIKKKDSDSDDAQE